MNCFQFGSRSKTAQLSLTRAVSESISLGILGAQHAKHSAVGCHRDAGHGQAEFIWKARWCWSQRGHRLPSEVKIHHVLRDDGQRQAAKVGSEQRRGEWISFVLRLLSPSGFVCCHHVEQVDAAFYVGYKFLSRRHVCSPNVWEVDMTLFGETKSLYNGGQAEFCLNKLHVKSFRMEHDYCTNESSGNRREYRS